MRRGTRGRPAPRTRRAPASTGGAACRPACRMRPPLHTRTGQSPCASLWAGTRGRPSARCTPARRGCRPVSLCPRTGSLLGGTPLPSCPTGCGRLSRSVWCGPCPRPRGGRGNRPPSRRCWGPRRCRICACGPGWWPWAPPRARRTWLCTRPPRRTGAPLLLCACQHCRTFPAPSWSVWHPWPLARSRTLRRPFRRPGRRP